MKLYYSQQNKQFYGFESDGSQDYLLNPDMVEITSERPSQFHLPIIVDGEHTGEWDLDVEAKRQASIPAKVSNRQGKLALIEFGYIDEVEAAIEAIPDLKQKRIAKAEYEAAEWSINSEFLQGFWQQLGGTQEQLEDLFIYAAEQ